MILTLTRDAKILAKSNRTTQLETPGNDADVASSILSAKRQIDERIGQACYSGAQDCVQGYQFTHDESGLCKSHHYL